MPRKRLGFIFAAAILLVIALALFLWMSGSRRHVEPADITPLRESLERSAQTALVAPPVVDSTLRLTATADGAPALAEKVTALAKELGGAAIKMGSGAETTFMVQIPSENAAAFRRRLTGTTAASPSPIVAGETEYIDVVIAIP